MFLGEHQHTLDAKGRVSLPAKFRARLAGPITVAKGLDNALYVFPTDAYEEFVGVLMAKEDFNPRVRELRRFFSAGASQAELDSAGRVSLPSHLREWAKLDKDVTVIGNGNRIELWNAAAWSAYNSQTAANVEDLAQELADAGLL